MNNKSDLITFKFNILIFFLKGNINVFLINKNLIESLV